METLFHAINSVALLLKAQSLQGSCRPHLEELSDLLNRLEPVYPKDLEPTIHEILTNIVTPWKRLYEGLADSGLLLPCGGSRKDLAAGPQTSGLIANHYGVRFLQVWMTRCKFLNTTWDVKKEEADMATQYGHFRSSMEDFDEFLQKHICARRLNTIDTSAAHCSPTLQALEQEPIVTSSTPAATVSVVQESDSHKRKRTPTKETICKKAVDGVNAVYQARREHHVSPPMTLVHRPSPHKERITSKRMRLTEDTTVPIRANGKGFLNIAERLKIWSAQHEK